MRAIVYKIFLVLLFSLLYIQIFDYIALNGEKPDILLILTLFIAQKKGIMEGQIVGFFSGLMEDFFSIQLFGIHSFCKLIIGNLTVLLYNNFVIENIGFQFILGLLGASVQAILFVLAKGIFDNIDFFYYFKTSLWIKVLYTAFLTPLIFFLLNFLEKHFGEA
jgi:rod shape-determining protein MreD